MDDDDRMSESSGSSYEPDEPPNLPSAPSPKRAFDFEGNQLVDKKIRLDGQATTTAFNRAAHLPAEIWQHIFSFLPPPVLGLSMMVCKGFRSCLDGSIAARQKSSQGRLQTVDSEALWATWRITHPEGAANMPKPLEGCSERHMWRLVRGTRCDACNKLDDQPRKPTSPDVWRGGPSMSTTRAVWPFALRLCGECLFKNCEKDTALLCTPAKQFRSALPYAFLTHDFNYVPTTVLKEAGQSPSGLHISKQFFKGHVYEILEEWERTLGLGQAAAEEWLKGLDGMGNHTMTDAARWEHWETKGGLNRVLFAFTQLQPAPLIHPTPTPGWVPNNMAGWPIQSVPPQQQQQLPPAPGMPPMSLPQNPSAPAMNMPFSQPPPQFSPQGQMQSQFFQPPQQANAAMSQQQRTERNPHAAGEAKAARRQQIEQRCLHELVPPILPNVLRHMSSFQASIQIGFPLNDAAWESLKPKLLEQRAAAERTELEHTAQLLALQQQVDAQSRRHMNSKESRDAQEKEWEEALKPQREKLSAIADDHIRQSWRGGQSVNSGNVARFAMSVFDYVRRAFYTELDASDRIAAATGQQIPDDPPDGPFQRRLTLETMKWVYDHKIRPLTRDYGKEIFFCNGPGCEMTNKHFAFEGVIQHYGAKHTNDFSKGNVIVHWQSAEWPEEMPFYDPGSGPMRPPYQGNGGYSRGTTISPQVNSGALFSVPSLTTSPFGATPLSGDGSGPFTPPTGNGYPPYIFQAMQQGQGVGHAGSRAGPVGQHGGSQSFDPTDLSQFFKSEEQGSPTMITPTVDKGSTEQLSAILDALKARSVQPASQTASGLGNVQSTDIKANIMDTDIPDFEVYQEQLKHVADTARLAWTSTNAIHGMPTSVRVFAVIQYSVSQFLNRFSSQLSLGTFTAALTNNPMLEPLKQADDMLCNQCQLSGSAVQGSNSLTSPTSLFSLISHFQSAHAQHIASTEGHRPAGWVNDMVALPGLETIADLINAPGMTDDKLSILGAAFPEQLPRRMPRHKEPKDQADHRPGKRNKRYGRKASNGRRIDLEDPNNMDSERSGSGFRSSNSPGEANGSRRRSPKTHGDKDDDEEYDPSKPALLSGAPQPKKRREIGRKTSGMGADLAELLAAATEQSNQAAAEENRRRGIVSDSHRHDHGAPPSMPQELPVGSYHAPAPGSRPGSGPRPQHAYVHDQELVERRLPYGGYPRPERSHDSQMDDRQPERTGSRHARLVREDYGHPHVTTTPPSAGRRSRYARYDEQHERMLRERSRSRSPIRYDDQAVVERPHPPRQREYLGPGHPPSFYRYPNEPEPIYVDQYGRPVRLVRIEDDAPPPPGYVIQRPSPGEIEYVERRPAPDPRYYEIQQDPRYDTRSAPYASQQMPARDTRYVD